MDHVWPIFFRRAATTVLAAALLAGCTVFQQSGPVLIEDQPVIPTVAVLPSLTPTVKPSDTATPTPPPTTPPGLEETARALVTPTLPPSRTPTTTATPTQTPTFTWTPSWTPPPTQTPLPTFPPPPVVVPTQPVVPVFPTVPGQAPLPAPSILPEMIAAPTAPTNADGSCVHGWFFSQPAVTGCPFAPAATTDAVYLEFERGRMFWIAVERKIYVLYTDGQLPRWERYPDTWSEGMVERDPSIVGPVGLWQQPRRGFGHLWRSNGHIRARLGWAMAEWEVPITAQLQQAGAESGATIYLAEQGEGQPIFMMAGDQSNWDTFQPPAAP